MTIEFAKLTEGEGNYGPSWSQKHPLLQKHGDWVLIGKNDADLAKLKFPGDVIAYLEKPQAEDIRFWFRTRLPEFLAGLKETFRSHIKSNLAHLPAGKRESRPRIL